MKLYEVRRSKEEFYDRSCSVVGAYEGVTCMALGEYYMIWNYCVGVISFYTSVVNSIM